MPRLSLKQTRSRFIREENMSNSRADPKKRKEKYACDSNPESCDSYVLKSFARSSRFWSY